MKNREIVWYSEQHTMMTQDVTIFTNGALCQEMLNEYLTIDSKRELFQTYYLHQLNNTVKISGKHNYGDWNASIGDISNTNQYLPQIIEKLKGVLTHDDVEKNITIVHNIAGLSLKEKMSADSLKEEMLATFEVPQVKKLKI